MTNTNTASGAADLLKCKAADGSTEVINVPGYPLMVRAVDFNRLRAKVEELSAAQVELAAMRTGGEPVMWAFQYSDGSWHHGSGTEHSAGMKPLYTHPRPAAQDADPLQGAANWLAWLAQAHGQFCVAVLQDRLMIGYNRAKRLHDAAIAAQQGDSHE